MLRDEIERFQRSVEPGRVARENKLHNRTGETQDEENVMKEDVVNVVICCPSSTDVFGKFSQRSDSLDNVSGSGLFFDKLSL